MIVGIDHHFLNLRCANTWVCKRVLSTLLKCLSTCFTAWQNYYKIGCYDSCSCVQVLSAATVIAKHTAGLCNACKAASTKTENPVAKRHFVQSAKDVANNTANLVKNIKVNCFFSVSFFFPTDEIFQGIVNYFE